MFSLILLFPLFSILFSFLFLRKIGSRGVWFLIWASTFITFIGALEILFLQIASSFMFCYQFSILPFFAFFSHFDITWSIKVDYLSTLIAVLITLISFFIQTFSGAYMRFDVSYARFICFIAFFSFSILLLVFGSNFLVLFVGWEIVGFASFLLINFWYSRQEANYGAFKAFTFNRFGDSAILLAMAIIFFKVGHFEFDTVIFFMNYQTADLFFGIAFFFIFVGAFAKSAQFFFHSWLPDAMEGPTPVSALLHSATMVTAGIYLSLRFSDVLTLFPIFQFFVALFGIFTSFYAAVISTTVLDSKHSTAYTTLGQLGFIFFAVGSGAFSAAIFHLFVHGFYKSFAFLENAIELYALDDEQDGSLVSLSSYMYENIHDIFGFIVFLSVNALPLASSSVSKELLVFSGFEGFSNFFSFFFFSILFIGFIDSTLDDFSIEYSSLFIMPSSPVLYTPFPMFFSYTFLGFLSIFMIFFTEDLFINLSFIWSDFFDKWLFLDGTVFLLLPFAFTLVTAVFFPVTNSAALSNYKFISFFDNLFYYDLSFVNFGGRFIGFISFQTFYIIDKGLLDYFFVKFFVKLSSFRIYIYKNISESFFSMFSLSFLLCFIAFFLFKLYFKKLNDDFA